MVSSGGGRFSAEGQWRRGGLSKVLKDNPQSIELAGNNKSMCRKERRVSMGEVTDSGEGRSGRGAQERKSAKRPMSEQSQLLS